MGSPLGLKYLLISYMEPLGKTFLRTIILCVSYGAEKISSHVAYQVERHPLVISLLGRGSGYYEIDSPSSTMAQVR